MPRLAKADVSRQPGIRTRPSGGPRGLAVNGLLPLIKLLNLLWFHYFGYFQLYLEYELVYRTAVGTVLLPQYQLVPVPQYPLHLATQAEIAVKATAPFPLRRPVSIALGLKRVALVRRSSAARFRVVCRPRTDDSARAGR